MTAPRDPAPKAGGLPPGTGFDDEDRDEAEWRHPPVVPNDTPNPLDALGETVTGLLTGSKPPTPASPPAAPEAAAPSVDKDRPAR